MLVLLRNGRTRHRGGACVIYPDLDREQFEDRTLEIERANRATDAARALVARVVANHRASRKPYPPNRREKRVQPAGTRTTARGTVRKSNRGRPPADPERLAHWGALLLGYVARDSDEQREVWRQR